MFNSQIPPAGLSVSQTSKNISEFYRRHYVRRFYLRAFRNQNSMVAWFTNSSNSYEGMIFLISLRKKKLYIRYKRRPIGSCIGLNFYVMRQSACLVINPNIFDNYAASGSAVRLYDGPDLKLFMLVGWSWSFLSFAWLIVVQLHGH